MLLFCALILRMEAISSSKWKNIDYDALEKSWEEGDEQDELQTEGDILFSQAQKR